MAREFPFGPKIDGGGIPFGKASYTVRSTKSGTKVTGTVKNKNKKQSSVESTSYRGKELTKKERKEIAALNKAAESMKSKNIDRVESGKKGAKTRKLRQEEREDYAYSVGKKKGEKVGQIKGAVKTVAVIGAGLSLAEKKKKENKQKSSKKKK